MLGRKQKLFQTNKQLQSEIQLQWETIESAWIEDAKLKKKAEKETTQQQIG